MQFNFWSGNKVVPIIGGLVPPRDTIMFVRDVGSCAVEGRLIHESNYYSNEMVHDIQHDNNGGATLGCSFTSLWNIRQRKR